MLNSDKSRNPETALAEELPVAEVVKDDDTFIEASNTGEKKRKPEDDYQAIGDEISSSKSKINPKFFRDALYLIRIVTLWHPGWMVLVEIAFVISFTALLLIVLPVPESYTSVVEPIDRRILYGIFCPILGLSTLIQIGYALSQKFKAGGKSSTWTSEIRKRSIPILLLLAQAYNIAGFFTMLIPSLMYAAMVGTVDGSTCGDFPKLIGQAMGYIICVTFCKALLYFFTESASLLWRKVLTDTLHEAYLERGKAYYQLRLLFPNTIDNPDQRITQECQNWCQTLANLLNMVAIAFFDIFWYTFQTWNITGWQGPLVMFGYFIICTAFTQVFAIPVPGLLARSDRAEGDFRIVHTTLLAQAEETALMSGGKPEAFALEESLEELLRRKWRYVRANSLLQLDIYFWQYTGSIVNYIVIALPVCAGAYSGMSAGELSSLISRGSSFAISMAYGFTQLITATTTLAELAGRTSRITELMEGLSTVEDIAAQWKRDEDSTELHRIKLELTTDDLANPDVKLLTTLRLNVSVPKKSDDIEKIRLNDSTIKSQPFHGDLPLLESVDINVTPMGKVLIRGPPGCGKSSILRTVCRLWPMTSRVDPLAPETDFEAIYAPSQISCIPPLWDNSAALHIGDSEVLAFMVLPQSAVFRIGIETNLFEQLAYPLMLSNDNMRAQLEMENALKLVGLTHLIEKAGGFHKRHSHSKWVSIMSPGQRQLFACARVFVHKPALVLLDEATSSMPRNDEERIYKTLAQLGIAYVSIGHRDTLIPFHDHIINCPARI